MSWIPSWWNGELNFHLSLVLVFQSTQHTFHVYSFCQECSYGDICSVHIDVTSVSLINYIDRWKTSSENMIQIEKNCRYIIEVKSKKKKLWATTKWKEVQVQRETNPSRTSFLYSCIPHIPDVIDGYVVLGVAQLHGQTVMATLASLGVLSGLTSGLATLASATITQVLRNENGKCNFMAYRPTN